MAHPLKKDGPPRKRKRGAPKLVADILDRVAAPIFASPEAGAHRIWPAWMEAVGPDIARHTEPVTIREGVLHVRVDASVWVTQLTFLKPEILNKLAPLMDDGALTDIKFKQGALKGAEAQRAAPEEPPPLPHATPDEQTRAREMVDEVRDEDLRDVLYRFVLKGLVKGRED